MAAGLQVWDASGNLILDASYRVMRIISSKVMDGTNGSLPADARLMQGAFVSFQPDNTCGDGYLAGGVITPRFSIDASTGILSWSYASKNSATFDIYQTGILFYGAS